jgi:hypothetical protein
MFEVDNGRESKIIKVLISVEVAKQVLNDNFFKKQLQLADNKLKYHEKNYLFVLFLLMPY